MKRTTLIALLSLIILSACSAKKDLPAKTTNTVTTSSGNTLSFVLTGEEYVALERVTQAEKSNQKYFDSKTTLYEQLDSKDIPLVLAIQGLTDERQPTNYNDVLVSDNAASVAKNQAWAGVVVGGAKSIVGGLLGYKGLDVAGDVVGTFATLAKDAKANNTVYVDNGSTYQGAQDDSVYNASVNQEGLVVNPIDVEPVQFTDAEPVVNTSGLDACQVAGIAAGFPDAEFRTDGSSICSNGIGGIIDL